MKKSLIFFSCLLSFAFLQINLVSADCGCGKKKDSDNPVKSFFSGGCGCGGGGGNGSNDIPPDQE